MEEGSEVDARLALLERIGASSQLRRAPRLQELLVYLGKRSVEDRCESLHEQTIGVDVFGRPAGYDTGSDNIVRTSVSELRKRLNAYFSVEGSEEELGVEIPRWNYVLSFHAREIEKPPVFTVAAAVQAPVAVAVAPPAPMEVLQPPAMQAEAQISRRLRWIAVALAILVAALAIGCATLWMKYRAASQRYAELNRSIYGWTYDPAVFDLWSRILGAREETDIVLADASFGLLQDLDRRSFSLNNYLSRSYVEQLRDQRSDPALRTVLDRITTWNLGSQDEFMLARRILALDPPGSRIRLYTARNYMPALAKKNNIILIGGRLSNPWHDVFQLDSNFDIDFATNGSIAVTNRQPLPSEQAIYQQTPSAQYCIISYRKNPEHNGVILQIQGTDAEATEAAGDFLLEGEKLADFAKLLHTSRLPYFEVLLRVSSVPGTPLTTSIEAYRAYSH